MSVVNTFWSYVDAWFGYVSWCLSATDLACRPFLAFVALLGASGGTLVLLCVALSALLNDLADDLEQRRRERRMVQEAAMLREKVHARAARPSAIPDVHIEPQLAPAVVAMSAVEDGWRGASVAGATLTPPPPPAF